MLKMFFHVFLHISTHISLGFLSQGSTEADIGWDEKLNGHLMASCVRNIHTKNYENLIISVQVRIENVRDVFWDTVYYVCQYSYDYKKWCSRFSSILHDKQN